MRVPHNKAAVVLIDNFLTRREPLLTTFGRAGSYTLRTRPSLLKSES